MAPDEDRPWKVVHRDVLWLCGALLVLTGFSVGMAVMAFLIALS